MDVHSCFMCLSFFFSCRCFPIDFIVIVLMLRSLMPAVIFAFVIAFIKFICIFMYFFALHFFFFFRAAVCVFTSLFIGKVCLFACVYFSAFICWCVSGRSWVKQRIREPGSGRESWRGCGGGGGGDGQVRDAVPCDERQARVTVNRSPDK